MTGAMVQVRQTGDAYRATSTDARLRGLEWRWQGDPYVEVGFVALVSGEWRPLAAMNVWDYEQDRATIDRTWDAFGCWVRDRYADDDEVNVLVDALAQSC